MELTIIDNLGQTKVIELNKQATAEHYAYNSLNLNKDFFKVSQNNDIFEIEPTYLGQMRLNFEDTKDFDQIYDDRHDKKILNDHLFSAFSTNEIKLALELGADIEGGDSNYGDVTPLAYSSEYICKDEVLMELIRAGAEVNVRDDYGQTPLIYAIIHDKIELVRELLNHGADINMNCESWDSDYGKSPVDFASGDVKDLLIKHRC